MTTRSERTWTVIISLFSAIAKCAKFRDLAPLHPYRLSAWEDL